MITKHYKSFFSIFRGKSQENQQITSTRDKQNLEPLGLHHLVACGQHHAVHIKTTK
jgi:hypothetical protein